MFNKQKIDTKICKNPIFWRNKLNKEYPNTIRKFPNDSDFRKIYLSLKNKIINKYYIFISYDGKDNQEPKIWDFIKRSPIEDEDYESADVLYEDFNERVGEDTSFEMIGDFPKGTKIWLVYCDDSDFGFKNGFLTKEEAINAVLRSSNSVIEDDYGGGFEELAARYDTPEQFYRGTLEEVKERNKRFLLENDFLQIKGHDNRRSTMFFPINYVLKEFELP